MKALIAFLLVCFAAVAVFAEAPAQGSPEAANLWAEYRAAKAPASSALTALEEGVYAVTEDTAADMSAIVAKFEVVIAVAEKLERHDIGAWNLNNAGYALICYFRQITHWQAANDMINTTTDKKERRAKALAMQADAVAHLAILHEADKYLARADGSGFTDKGFLAKVQSNSDFITWVREFSVKKF